MCNGLYWMVSGEVQQDSLHLDYFVTECIYIYILLPYGLLDMKRELWLCFLLFFDVYPSETASLTGNDVGQDLILTMWKWLDCWMVVICCFCYVFLRRTGCPIFVPENISKKREGKLFWLKIMRDAKIWCHGDLKHRIVLFVACPLIIKYKVLLF